MFITQQLEELAKKLYSILPDNVQNLETDMQRKFQEILNVAFNKLDLVTREEFDTQQKVLLATRKKLEELEQQVKELSVK